MLFDYDLVFAAGKSALDAMACGAAVVTVGMTSCGEMVCPENFDRLRLANFSVAINSVPLTPDRIGAEIARYTADGCALVTRRVRKEADGELMISEMEAIYEKAMAAHAHAGPNPLAEQQAVAQYLRELAPLMSLLHDSTKAGELAAAGGFSARRLASAQMAALDAGRAT